MKFRYGVWDMGYGVWGMGYVVWGMRYGYEVGYEVCGMRYGYGYEVGYEVCGMGYGGQRVCHKVEGANSNLFLQAFCDKRRGSKMSNHLMAVKEGIGCVGWVTVVSCMSCVVGVVSCRWVWS